MGNDELDHDLRFLTEAFAYTSDDETLEERLRQQDRPARPDTLEDARHLAERLVAAGLAQTMTPPEARVEATRVVAWLESRVREDLLRGQTGS